MWQKSRKDEGGRVKYGMPYKGSKSGIAEWVVSKLPAAHTFVDLFAGGCAITHAALLSGKYKRVVCNDISGTPIMFKEAIDGEFEGWSGVVDRAGFFLSDDAAIKILYSFGNDKKTYCWDKRYEQLKVNAEKMLTAGSLHERRMYYRAFMKEMIRNEGLKESVLRTEGVERLERVRALAGLKGNVEVMVSDYRNVNIPDGAVVYADPPYRGSGEQYGGFDFAAFDEWLGAVDFPVYVSECAAPRGCVCIAERRTSVHMSATGSSERVERIFVQERFARRE